MHNPLRVPLQSLDRFSCKTYTKFLTLSFNLLATTLYHGSTYRLFHREVTLEYNALSETRRVLGNIQMHKKSKLRMGTRHVQKIIERQMDLCISRGLPDRSDLNTSTISVIPLVLTICSLSPNLLIPESRRHDSRRWKTCVSSSFGPDTLGFVSRNEPKILERYPKWLM